MTIPKCKIDEVLLDDNTRIIRWYNCYRKSCTYNLTVEVKSDDGCFIPIIEFNTYPYDDENTIISSDDMRRLYYELNQELFIIKGFMNRLNKDQSVFKIKEGECIWEGLI